VFALEGREARKRRAALERGEKGLKEVLTSVINFEIIAS
jgi:hypothetical protein